MASKTSREERIKEKGERIKEKVATVLATVLAAEADGDAWEHETVDDIEDAMAPIGDLVAREVGVQKFVRHTEQSKRTPPPFLMLAGPVGY